MKPCTKLAKPRTRGRLGANLGNGLLEVLRLNPTIQNVIDSDPSCGANAIVKNLRERH